MNIPSIDEIMESIGTSFKNYYGNDFNFNPESNAYKFNRPIGDNIERLFQKIVAVRDAQSVFKATGSDLDDLLMGNYNFPRKQPSKASTTWRTIDSEPGSTVAIGELIVGTSSGINFTNTIAGTVDVSGVLELSIQSQDTGIDTNVGTGTITNIVTPVTGIRTGSNPTQARGGQDQETDRDYFYRWTQSNNNSFWNVDGILTAILEVDGVISAYVLENDSKTPLDIGGGEPLLPANSRRYYVYGGVTEEIARAVYYKTDRAIEESGGLTSETIQIDDLNGDPRDVIISRPQNNIIEYTFTVEGAADVTLIGNLIKQYIDETKVGGDINSSQCQEYVYANTDTTGIRFFSVSFRRDGDVTFVNRIVLGKYERATGELV